MEIEYEIKYPCGLRMNMKNKYNIFDITKGNVNTNINECPIHGKKCKR